VEHRVVEVKRKKGESFEALMRRFTRRVQDSGRLLQAKKVRFYESGKNKNAEREAALRRKEISDKREYLLKSGKVKEDFFFDQKKKGRGRR
jgi:ribosomal protein S21